VDDLPILEVDFRQGSAHLGTKLDAIDCRELADGPDPDVNIPLQRIADRDSRNRRRRRNRGLRRVIPGVGKPEAATEKDGEDRKLPAQVLAIANLLVQSDAIGDLRTMSLMVGLPCVGTRFQKTLSFWSNHSYNHQYGGG
jgi:hypothetical protein